jgi:major membrane immunogen (membrane-anchored lipoprotein)
VLIRGRRSTPWNGQRMRRCLVVLLVPALLFTACGGDDDSTAATTTTSAPSGSCPDEATIGSIAGAPSKKPDATVLPGRLQCTYSVEDATAGIFGVVNITVYTKDVASALDTFKSVADDEQKVDVVVGDEAWWAPSVTDLFVVYKDVGADILLSGLGEGDDAKAIAIALAKPALA